MKTYTPTPKDINRDWIEVDAEGQVLGRLASQVATRLRGKHKPEFAPHMDNGDFVVVVNAAKIRVTGKKLEDKMYYNHSGYTGGMRARSLATILETKPELAIIEAVKGMLPRNRLGRAMLKKLKVYAGPEHPHEAQKPTKFEL